jgi:hypothetical protein
MNVERLSEILKAITSDLDDTGLLPAIGTVMSALDTLMSQPPDTTHQENLKKNLENLHTSIQKSNADDFPRTWRPYLSELGVLPLLGSILRERVDGIIERNGITYAIAKDELQTIRNELATKKSSFDQILAGISGLELTTPMLEPGYAELSFLFPMEAFDGCMASFGNEVKFFDSATGFFSELATKTREAPKIHQLSNPDPVIVIGITIQTAIAMLKVVNQILEVMEHTFKLREAKASAIKAEASKKSISYLDNDIKALIDKGLTEIKTRLFKQYKLDRERANELKIMADKVLPKLASRIDNGYQIDGDVAVEDEEEAVEGEEPDKDKQLKRQIASELIEVSRQIRYRSIPDGPVLHLPKPNEPEGEDGGGEGVD